MKKTFLLCLLLLAALPLAALRCGDKAAELPNLKYLHGMRRQVAAPAQQGTLRVVTFIHSRAQGALETTAMLAALDSMYKGKVFQTLVTPDPESDAVTLLGGVRSSTMALAVDSSRRITMQYMSGSLLYPKSFVIGHDGRIIWCGESVDLGEMLQEYFSGRFDVSAARKICPMLDELQTLLRESSERKMKQLTDKIFAISPAHAGALRMRLFALENSNRIPAAWTLLQERMKAAPRSARVYFTAVDFVSRFTYFKTALEPLLAAFNANVPQEDSRCMMAWELLKRFRYDLTALKYAALLSGKTPTAAPGVRPVWYAIRAQVAYLTGNIPEAVSFQKKVRAAAGQLQQKDAMLEYFEGVELLRKKGL